MALREHVSTFTFPLDRAGTYALLLSKLRSLGLDVVDASEERGEITFRCLAMPFNMVLWRCWSDKVLLQVRTPERARTQVGMYAIPNLLRIWVRRGEEVVDLKVLATRLSEAQTPSAETR